MHAVDAGGAVISSPGKTSMVVHAVKNGGIVIPSEVKGDIGST